MTATPSSPPQSPAPRLKSFVLTALKFAVPVIIISWLLWRMEPEQWELLRSQPRNYPLLAAALAAALVAMCISYARWWALVRCQGIQLGVVEAFRLSAISFLLSFVSAGSVGGDLFKMVFLARRNRGKGIEAVASVIVDRSVGLLGLLLVVAAAVALAGRNDPELARIGHASLVLSAVGLAILAVLVLGGRPIDRLIVRTARLRFIGGALTRIAGPLRVFHRRPIVLGLTLLVSIAVHALLVLSVYWIARSLYAAAAPSLAEHAMIVPVANLASALPIAPAGIGVLEAAMQWLYEVVPARPTAASGTLVALVFEIVKVAMAVIGMIFYWTAPAEVRHSLEGAQSAEQREPRSD